jgi:hypothetical protein
MGEKSQEKATPPRAGRKDKVTRMTENTSLTKAEKSLLLFLETQVVDYGGAIDTRRINAADRGILKQWVELGFVKSGRICLEDIERFPGHPPRPVWVVLSPDAWEMAHNERVARATRMWKNRRWKTTGEKRAAAPCGGKEGGST